jgi:hypothetical protein
VIAAKRFCALERLTTLKQGSRLSTLKLNRDQTYIQNRPYTAGYDTGTGNETGIGARIGVKFGINENIGTGNNTAISGNTGISRSRSFSRYDTFGTRNGGGISQNRSRSSGRCPSICMDNGYGFARCPVHFGLFN